MSRVASATPWPRSTEDLLRVPLESFFRIMVQWTSSYPYPPFTTLIALVYGLVAAPRPRLLMDWMPTIVPYVYSRALSNWSRPIVRPEACILSADAMEQVAILLDWLAHTSMALLSPWLYKNHDGSRVFARRCLEAHRLFRRMSAGNTHLQVCVVQAAFLRMAVRVHQVLGWPSEQGPSPIVRDSFADLAGFMPFLAGPRVCANAQCGRSFSADFHGLRMCSRCQHVFYCDKKCQRSAWRHSRSPHREVCSLLQCHMSLLKAEYAAHHKTLGDDVTEEDVVLWCKNAGMQLCDVDALVGHLVAAYA